MLHLPGARDAGRGIGDGIAVEAAVEMIERAHARLCPRTVRPVEQPALNGAGGLTPAFLY
jgi:hypothetical protein